MKFSRSGAFTVALAGASVFAPTLIAQAFDLRLNLTPSLPIGIYLPDPNGNIVEFCPPMLGGKPMHEWARIGRGSCPDGSIAFLKPIAAFAGDTVVVDDRGIRVNGKRLVNSRPHRTDAAGRTLPAIPQGTYVVHPGQIWVISSHHLGSIDSRYFGPIALETIRWRGHFETYM